MEGLRAAHQDLLQDSDNIRVVKCLGCECVDDRRNVDLASSEQGRVLELLSLLVPILLQKVDV